MFRNSRYLFKILTIALFIASCSSDNPVVEIAGNEVNQEILRFEIDLFENTNSQLNQDDIEFLKTKYGKFYELFVEGIIAVGQTEDSITAYYLNHFKNDASVLEIANSCKNSFEDLSSINEELNTAFSRYKALFPSKTIPEFYSFISAFSYTIVVDNDLIGIGLDMYLSNEHDYYDRLGIPAYKKSRMQRAYITSDVMKSWIGTEYEMNAENVNLLSHMIYHGKLLYALDLLLPNKHDTIKISYTGEQLKWAEENLTDMWFHFADNELFYSKESSIIQKYIGEGPFTPGFPEGSPAMAGRWLGWQIVKKYMGQVEDPLDLNSLFEEVDAQKILTESKFKP